MLPDSRVEKTIHSDLRLGNKISYIGLKIKDPKDIPNTREFNLSMRTALYKMGRFQKELKKLVDDVDPDVIHAHDILMGRAAVGLGYPIVYNDHEYHSKKEWVNNPLATPWTKIFLKRKLTWVYRYLKFRLWEQKIFSEAVVITANENVAKKHQEKGATVFVMPNQPEKKEVEIVWKQARSSSRDFDAVYVGNDMSRKSPPYRQAHQAFALLKNNHKLIIVGDNSLESDGLLESTGYVHHDRIYTHAMKARTGLLAWKPHYFHPYCSPNKFYFYIHAGNVPIVPHTFEYPSFDLSLKFKKVNHIPKLIAEAKKLCEPNDIINLAKDYIWNKYDDQLEQAYEKLISR